MRPVAERLVAVRARMRELEHAQGELVIAIGGNGGGYAATDLNEAQTELGVVLKDLDLGLLDFPSVREGEDVLLCWQVGEEAVTSWHRLEEGFAGRKPIDWSE
ncbi:MAG: hypothetical protein QOH28_1868 [Actinomycetota bacterium]|nr:hypothetical protein [Actinomycetota bacterium]